MTHHWPLDETSGKCPVFQLHGLLPVGAGAGRASGLCTWTTAAMAGHDNVRWCLQCWNALKRSCYPARISTSAAWQIVIAIACCFLAHQAAFFHNRTFYTGDNCCLRCVPRRARLILCILACPKTRLLLNSSCGSKFTVSSWSRWVCLKMLCTPKPNA